MIARCLSVLTWVGTVVAWYTPTASPLRATAEAASIAALQVGAGERLLIVAPHPDDETLGAAGLAQRVLSQAGKVHVVAVTAGDGFTEAVRARTGATTPSAEQYLALGQTRLRELRRATDLLGRGQLRLRALGFPDGSIAALLGAHWDAPQPLRSPTTQVSAVPYRELPSHAAAYSGKVLFQQLTAAVRELRPTRVAFSDPLDEHPDHAAVGVFTLRALNEVYGARDEDWPKLIAYLVHWRAWPPDSASSGVMPDAQHAELHLPADLPARGHQQVCLTLRDVELERKAAALGAHATQLAVTPMYLQSFVRRTECFAQLTPSVARAAIGDTDR